MRTEKQIEASRLNGAWSPDATSVRPYPRDSATQGTFPGQGPVTAEGKCISAANSAFSTGPRTHEGKARSARNAEKRQIFANSIALPAERNEEFLELLHNYRHSLRPVGFLEDRVVETITASDWHRRRYWFVSMTKIAHATALQERSCDDFTWKFSQEFGATLTAEAVSDLVEKGRSLDFFRRCEAGYSREYRNARKELKELQTDRRKYEQAILDEGGDSTDFECFEEERYEENSEPTEPGTTEAVVDAEPEKSTQPTEPDILFRGVGTSGTDDHGGDAVVFPDNAFRDVLPVAEADTQPGRSEKNTQPTEPDVPFRDADSNPFPGAFPINRIPIRAVPLKALDVEPC